MKALGITALALALIAGAGTSDLQAHPRRHFRSGSRHHVSFGVHLGYPYYGYPYYGFAAYGYYPWVPYPYGAYPGWVGPPAPPPSIGTVDLKVDPEEAEVWIGGALIGIADDFDGYPDVLALRPGRRTITLRHPGYRDMRVRLEIAAGADIHLRRRLVPVSETAR